MKEQNSQSECHRGDCSKLWGQWRRRTFLRKSFCLWLAHEAWSCQRMSEADERVCNYAVILTNTWDHLQKGSNDTEMRPCSESCMILEANGGNREQEWCDVAYGIEQQDWQHHSAPPGLSVRFLGAPVSKDLHLFQFWEQSKFAEVWLSIYGLHTPSSWNECRLKYS